MSAARRHARGCLASRLNPAPLTFWPRAEVRFWCAQALTALAAQQQPPLPPQARGQLKAALLASGTGAAGGPPLPGFLKNKVAQAIVALAGREYPDEWPSFFQVGQHHTRVHQHTACAIPA